MDPARALLAANPTERLGSHRDVGVPAVGKSAGESPVRYWQRGCCLLSGPSRYVLWQWVHDSVT